MKDKIYYQRGYGNICVYSIVQTTVMKSLAFICLTNFILLHITCEAVVFKESPVVINTEQDWEYITGFQALTRQYLIGKGKKYYYGSDNFGKTWEKIFVNETLNIRNDVTAVAIDDDGVAHNFGAIPFEIKNKAKLKYYQSLNSTFTTFFQYENDKFRYKYNPTQSISFSGIPYPGATCGDSKLAYGCPFRTGGRGIVKIMDEKSNKMVFVQSIIVYLDNEKYANPREGLKNYATTLFM